MEKKVNTSNTFAEILKRSNSKIREDRAERLSKSASMSYEAALNSKEKELFSIEDELETMIDMSADNRTTSINSVKDFDSDDFVSRRNKLLVKKELLKAEIKVIKTDASFYGN